jgi:hypothetical protein
VIFAHAGNQTAIASSTSLTVTLPLAVGAGDLLVAIVRSGDGALTAPNCSDNIKEKTPNRSPSPVHGGRR